ncbi:hypothetical protein VPH35_138958 [Triticum aestivum]
MSESTGELKTMLQALLKRFDETPLASDKQREAQIAFNTQVSTDLTHIRKQLDLTQADIDEVRQQQRELPPSPPAAECHRPNTADHHDGDTQASAVTSLEHDRGSRPQGPAVRLANNGPPLLPTRHALSYAGVGQTNAFMAGRDAHTGQREEYTVKPSKHDFPHFDGDAPSLWIDRCITYFDLYRVPPHSWVTTAPLYIDGHAAHWYQAYRQTHRSPSWQEFTAAIITKFAPDEFEMEMHKLLQLRQTGTVAEYRTAFETHMYHLLALDASLNTKLFITQFLLGLCDELRAVVCLQETSSITRAAVLARIIEEEAGTQHA